MNIKHKKLKTDRSIYDPVGKTRLVERKEPPAKTRSDDWVLRLYVAGQLPKTVTAFNNLKLICEEQLKGKYHIEVIDLLQNPQIAHDDHILAVPTLVRKSPLPERNIIGDLSNRERVLVGLGLVDHSALKRK